MVAIPVLQDRFAITIGDPAGIGPEVTVKAISKLPPATRRKLVVVGDRQPLEAAMEKADISLPLEPFDPQVKPGNGVAFVEVGAIPKNGVTPGRISAKGGRAAARYIETAVHMAQERQVAGIVTAPIHKKALNKAGYHFPGHTEMLAELTGSQNIAMMLSSKEMSVVVLTTHLSLKKAAGKVKTKAILDKLLLLKQNLSCDKPIAVCGLNPHASDGGLFGDEEEREIIPAIRKARKQGVKVEGPFPADTVVAPHLRRNFSAILAMYHDQGLVAIKAVSFGHCANITLGLPFIRTSVDHGTAMEIAGKNLADPSSMIFAVKKAFRMLAETRRKSK